MTDEEKIFLCLACEGRPGIQHQAGVQYYFCPHLRAGVIAPIGTDLDVVHDISLDAFNRLVFDLACRLKR
jgi:hypothetical protein